MLGAEAHTLCQYAGNTKTFCVTSIWPNAPYRSGNHTWEAPLLPVRRASVPASSEAMSRGPPEQRASLASTCSLPQLLLRLSPMMLLLQGLLPPRPLHLLLPLLLWGVSVSRAVWRLTRSQFRPESSNIASGSQTTNAVRPTAHCSHRTKLLLTMSTSTSTLEWAKAPPAIKGEPLRKGASQHQARSTN